MTNEDLDKKIDANELRNESYRAEIRLILSDLIKNIGEIKIQTTETNGKTKNHAAWIEKYQLAIDLLVGKDRFSDGSKATVKKIFTAACVLITTCAAIGSFIWWVVKRIFGIH